MRKLVIGDIVKFTDLAQSNGKIADHMQVIWTDNRGLMIRVRIVKSSAHSVGREFDLSAHASVLLELVEKPIENFKKKRVEFRYGRY